MTPSAGVLAAATALTVLAAVAVRGGYPAAFHGAFAALAGLALMAAVLADEREAGRLLRAPAVLVLWAIAALSVLSAAWTVGTVADAVRAGLVAAGYGALAVAGGVIGARARGAVLLSAGLACVAAAAAVWGLLAAGLHAEPWAERIYRRWQPGGPFEYPPALALLQVAALPALLRAMAGGPPRVAAAGAAGGALAASVLALGTSRFGLAAAATIALLALAAPAATVHASRGRVLAAVALLAAAGGVAYAVAGGRVAAGDDSGGAGRVAALSGGVIAAAAIWGAVASRLGRVPAEAAGGRRAAPVLALALAGVSAVALLGAGAGAAAGTSGPGGEGFTHGRTAIWGEALDTWGERPVAGAGRARTWPRRARSRPARASATRTTSRSSWRSSWVCSGCCSGSRSTRPPATPRGRRAAPRRCGCSARAWPRSWRSTSSTGRGTCPARSRVGGALGDLLSARDRYADRGDDAAAQRRRDRAGPHELPMGA